METLVISESERVGLLTASENFGAQRFATSGDGASAGSPKQSLFRVLEGVLCLVTVAFIWVGASVLVQYIFSEQAQLPFFLTYICNSEFIILLPLRYAHETYSARICSKTIPKAAQTDWKRAAKIGGTSVSSSTILSTTSCVFTFVLSVAFLKERFAWGKFLAVLITLGGAVMVSFSDSESGGANTWWGDALALFSALMYGVYTTAIRKFVPADGTISMQTFFGFLGLWNSLSLFPLVIILHFTGVENVSGVPLKFIGLILAKGLFDNVLSDLLWARAIHLTSPTVATIALALTIPIAMLADLFLHHIAPTALLACGSVAVCGGFILSTISLDDLKKRPAAAGTRLQHGQELDLAVRHEDSTARAADTLSHAL